jgi:hypothetical protein
VTPYMQKKNSALFQPENCLYTIKGLLQGPEYMNCTTVVKCVIPVEIDASFMEEKSKIQNSEMMYSLTPKGLNVCMVDKSILGSVT